MAFGGSMNHLEFEQVPVWVRKLEGLLNDSIGSHRSSTRGDQWIPCRATFSSGMRDPIRRNTEEA